VWKIEVFASEFPSVVEGGLLLGMKARPWKKAAFWDVAACSLVEIDRRFVGALMAVSTSETPVNVCQTAQRNIPEGSCLHTRRLENLKSHKAHSVHNSSLDRP
jgi:hypothetical protein